MTRLDLEPWQYRLSATKAEGARSVGPCWLAVGPRLPVIDVEDSEGTPLGVLLGFPIDLDRGEMIGGRWSIAGEPFRGDDPDAFVTAARRSLAGRFLWIFSQGAFARIYPDSSAQVPCVFDAAARVAGSTAMALLSEAEYDARLDRALFDHLGVEGQGWFPAGLTAHHGIRRLLPSHRLDLSTWEVRRFWPMGDLGTETDLDTLVDEFASLVRIQIEALLRASRRPALALTAGRETRLMLACARPFIDRVDFVTVAGGRRNDVDGVMARRIARDMGLNHIELPLQLATEAQRQAFIRRGGHCNADSNASLHPSVWPIADTHVVLAGNGGEVGRAFFWRPTDSPKTEIGAARLVGRFGLPPSDAVTGAVDGWLAEVPSQSTLEMLDLAYLEHRDGAWYAVQFCSDPTLLRLAPVLCDRGVELMMRLPPEWKRDSRLSTEVIRRFWPELATYPYNSLGPWRDTVARLQRAAGDPRIIAKKLRKMLS